MRWFEFDTSYASGFQHRRLPRLQFIDTDHPNLMPFGFVDPSSVLRAAYLMPAFNHGETKHFLSRPSPLARQPDDNDTDFMYYYVCMYVTHHVCAAQHTHTLCLCRFVYRDTYMRHLGGGIGHREQGVSLARSQEHALRHKRTGRIHMEATAGWRTITNTQVDVDSSLDADEDSDSESEDEDGVEYHFRGLLDSDKEEFPDNFSNSSHESRDSVADFYAMAGLRGRDRASSADEEAGRDHEGDEDDTGRTGEGNENHGVENYARQRGTEDDDDDLGSVDGRASDFGEGDQVMAGNVEHDEDYYMDDMYEAEGFAHL